MQIYIVILCFLYTLITIFMPFYIYVFHKLYIKLIKSHIAQYNSYNKNILNNNNFNI